MNSFKIGDKVCLNPARVEQWKREGNFWWLAYMDDETDVLEVVEIGRFIVTKAPSGRLIRQYKNDYVYPPVARQSKLCRKINKLYKKCPTTAHWEVSDV